jgi:transposase-like protein
VEAARKPFQGGRLAALPGPSHAQPPVTDPEPPSGGRGGQPPSVGATHAKRIFAAHDIAEARAQRATFVARFEKSAPKTVACLEEGFEDALSVIVLPEKYRKRLRTTNRQERLNEEIRRRERVIRLFPNTESALRLVGALLAEHNEVWAERHYLDMDEFHEWWAGRQPTHAGGNIVVLS